MGRKKAENKKKTKRKAKRYNKRMWVDKGGSIIKGKGSKWGPAILAASTRGDHI